MKLSMFLNLFIDTLVMPYTEDEWKGTPFVSPFLHASRVEGPSELWSGEMEERGAAVAPLYIVRYFLHLGGYTRILLV